MGQRPAGQQKSRLLALVVGAAADDALVRTVRAAGFDAALVSATAERVFAALDAGAHQLVIAAPGTSPELFVALDERWPELPVIAAVEDNEAGARAVAAGAADFVRAPLLEQELSFVVERALSRSFPDDAEPPSSIAPASELLGSSLPMQRLRELVLRTATTDATVLIRGETGTGKDLVARSLHALSRRRAGPLVKVHSAALPSGLLESELFGHERGAFTGALSRRQGRVELAAGGSLFLDEIGDVDVSTQVKLLRLLQDREFERVGGNDVLSADVRFMAATHRDLEDMMREGDFREDLFYRLNVVTLWVPPLRARRDDIELLARHFCAELAAAHGKPGLELSTGALAELRANRWPGNVRQLQNLVERLVVLASGKRLTETDVRETLNQKVTFSTESQGRELASTKMPSSSQQSSLHPLQEQLRDAERRALLKALERAKGNRTQAARLLGIGRRTLYSKLEEYSIE
jgi:two-component system, NtrC family, response regulator AtoC